MRKLQRIEFTSVESDLGWLLIAGTPRGVSHVRFGNSEQQLESELRSELPYAVIERNDVELKAWSDAICSYLAGHSKRLELPLDVRGSRFQQRVWQALRAIPRGETRSYSGLARELGTPRGARAVARACATNPVAVVVPCHRITRNDGELGGYRYGVARKQRLLELERD